MIQTIYTLIKEKVNYQNKRLFNKETWIIMTMLLGGIISALNSSMIVVALSSMAEAFQTSIAATTWVVTIYLISMAVMQPISGKMGDLFGYRKIYLIGIGLFIIGSLGCALSPNLGTLLIFRTIQAVGGALLMPNSIAILRNVISEERLPKALGLFGLIAGVGAAIGPFVGSMLLSVWEWPSIFIVNIPLLLFSLTASLLLIPEVKPLKGRAPLDYQGSLWLALCLGSIVMLSNAQSYVEVSIYGLCFLLSFPLFLRREKQTENPIIDLKLFRNQTFTVANLSVMLSNFTSYALLLTMPLFMEDVFRITEPLNGVLLSCFTIAMSIASFIGGKLHRPYGPKMIVRVSFIGMVFTNIGFTLIVFGQTLTGLILLLIVGGFSGGIGLPSMQVTSLSSLSQNMAGSASGIFSTFRYFGSIVATMVIGIINEFQILFLLFALMSGVGIIISLGYKKTTNS